MGYTVFVMNCMSEDVSQYGSGPELAIKLEEITDFTIVNDSQPIESNSP